MLFRSFVMLGLKSAAFGSAIAVITCYHGLAEPRQVDDIPKASIRAVTQSVVACVLIDAAGLLAYLLFGPYRGVS